jgi:hypothetical protein
MKKVYEIPKISYIKLSMDQAICSSCSVTATLEEKSCAVEIPGLGSVFTQLSNCMFTNDIDICYHTPVASSNVFSS